MARVNPYCNTKMVEDELNIKFTKHNHIKPEDVLVFAVIDDTNFYPVKTSLDSNGHFHLEDNGALIRRPLFVGSKRQFLYKQYNLQEDSIRIDLDNAFKTGWNPNKYIIFRNGYLLNSNLYKIYVPTFDSDYAIKCIYSSTTFKAGDRLDIFYIEHPDFQQVRFNQDIYIQTRRAYCETENQVLVKVPYPYDSYPRNKNMFYVVDDQTHHYLDNRYDYTVADGAEYIVLRNDQLLKKPYKDNLIFTFPYAKEDFEDESDMDGIGENSGVSFITLHSSYEPKANELYSNPDGLVYFDPPFNKYKLTKENIMIFCNTTFVNPERYKLKSNGCIQLLEKEDIAHYEYSRFTMLIFAETTKISKKYREFDFKIFQVFPTQDGQTQFTIPSVEPKNTDFMVFEGSLFFDVHNRYTWNTDVQPNTMTLNDPAIKIRTNRPLTFLFYTNSDNGYRKTKTMELVKIQFESTEDGKVHMYNSRKYDIEFNKQNSIIFMNGVYLEPDRYEIVDNDLKFTTPTDTIYTGKSFTGIYLVSHKLDTDGGDEGYFVHDEMSQGFKDKYLWFDELYTKPIITQVWE